MLKSIIQTVLLGIRAIFFVLIIPGTVTVYLPYRILQASSLLTVPESSVSTAAAGLLVTIGASVLVSCVWHFAAVGRGTLAPIDPPRQLVMAGLYQFTRNPMYNGVLAVLIGEAWLFGSAAVLAYAGAAFVVFHAVVVLYEEPVLTAKFGESYARYRNAVPRWGFTLHPFQTS